LSFKVRVRRARLSLTQDRERSTEITRKEGHGKHAAVYDWPAPGVRRRIFQRRASESGWLEMTRKRGQITTAADHSSTIEFGALYEMPREIGGPSKTRATENGAFLVHLYRHVSKACVLGFDDRSLLRKSGRRARCH